MQSNSAQTATIQTKIIKIDPISPDPQAIQECADIIKAGGVVASPTETVYGLFADAFNPTAVAKIFAAKGRPSDNPLIVHIATKEDATLVASNIDQSSQVYIDNFWPGPLTLILPKHSNVPDQTAANLSTIGVRMPSHPVAQALIATSGTPLAGPSANTSGRPSPTNAQHVIEDLFGKVDCIIDAGTTSHGLESTVLDTGTSTILRPGTITLADLNQYGNVTPYTTAISPKTVDAPASPGQKYKHYAPAGSTTLITGTSEATVASTIINLAKEIPHGATVAIIITDNTAHFYKDIATQLELITISLGNKNDPASLAHNLYNALRTCDTKGASHIFIEGYSWEQGDIYTSVMERLAKASSYNIIHAPS